MPESTRTPRIPPVALAMTLAAAALVARADDRPPHPHTPPPEAYAACDGKQADVACTVTFGARTLEGTCAATPDGRLACRPVRPPPPPEAFTACESKQSGDGCIVAFHDHAMQGTCAAIDDGRLACQPSGPPPQR
jgi:hypothetical protein